MDYHEYLLTCASEECIEVSKEVHKGLRFGLEDFNPDDPEEKPNKLLIALEYIDMIAAFELLKEEGIYDIDKVLEEYPLKKETLISLKKDKIKLFWGYSQKSKGNK